MSLVLLGLISTAVQGQTVVIDGTTTGSFEGANFAADGWITNQGSTSANNNLAIGSAATIGFTPTHGTKGVFVTNNGTSRGYANTSSWAWIYKDVTLNSGETKGTLTMDLFGNPADLGFDGIVVGISDQTFTASLTTGATATFTGTMLTGMTIATTATTNGFIEDGNYATATSRTFTIPVSGMGNGGSSTSRRIWIGWRADASTGNLTTPLSFDKVNFVTSAPVNYISNVASGNWSNAATWSPSGVPTLSDNVTIANGHTVTIDVATAACNNLTVGQGASGILQYDGVSARTLTVGGDVTIAAGGTFKSSATSSTSTITTHALSITGNLTNNGTLDFSTTAGAGGAVANAAAASIAFTGASNATFGGTGGTTDIRTLTINKGSSSATILELNPTNFTVQGTTTDGTPMGFLTLTNGTFKISGSFTLAARMFTSSGYTIGATTGVWLNNANFTVSGQAGSPTMSGLLRMTAGTFNVGTATGNEMSGATTSSMIIEGGTMNFTGRLSMTSAGASFNMSAGTINVCTIGNANSSTSSFQFSSTTSVFTMSGGTINIVQRNTAGTPFADYRVLTTSPTITGGTLNIGTAATATNFNFIIQGAVPNMVIDNTTNNKSVTLSANAAAYGNTTINSGTSLNLNGFTYQQRGATFTNNGILTGTVASSRLNFFSPTNAAMTFAGSGTITSYIEGLSCQTSAGLTISHTNTIPTLRANLFSGTITNSNKITLGTGAALAVTTQISSAASTTLGGSFDVAPTFNLGSGTYTVLYLQESAARSTGLEIPSSRSITAATFSNSNNVTVAGGALAIGTVTLGGGSLVTSAANPVTVTGTTTSSIVRSTYTSTSGATSSGTTISVSSTTGLNVGMFVTVSAGVGTFAAGTTVISIPSATTFVVSATPTVALSGGASVVSGIGGYVNGPLARILPLSLATGSTYLWPLGKSAYTPLELVNPITTSSASLVTISAEAFDADVAGSGGTVGTNMGSLATNRYWAASITANAGSFTSTTIRLTEATTIGTSNAIAGSSTLGGSYALIGGSLPTTTATTILTQVPAVSSLLGFYVMGVRSVPMSYTSSTTTQAVVTPVLKPTTDQQILGLQIVTAGSSSPLSATSFTLSTNGSTAAATDISNAKLWYTGTSNTFATTTQFGTTFSGPSGSFVIGGSQTLAEGTNYFWLTYDIPSGAVINNVVDAEFNSVTVGSAQTPTVQTIAGSRTIKAPLNGTYTIGTSQLPYALLKDAIADINTYGITGPVVLQLGSTYAGGTGETFPLSINNVTGGSGTNTITIKATQALQAISGSSASAIIVLNGADNIIIDGSSSSTTNTICPAVTASRDLTITNTNTSTTSAVVWLQTASGPNAATNNTIKNCNLVGNANTTTLFGVGAGSSTISLSSTGTGNISNSFINNNISKTQYGIYSGGASAANKNTGTIINQNVMNGVTPNNVGVGGILVNFDDGVQISGNQIANTIGSPDGFGISLGINSFINTTTTGSDVINATISKNTITNLVNNGTNSVAGIIVNGVTSGTTTISNNMISGVAANGTSSDFAAGIMIGGAVGSTTNVYYNTVVMNGTIQGGTAGSTQSVALAVTGSSVPTLTIRNNIFGNTQLPNASGTTKFYTIGLGYSSTVGNYANLISDHNDLYIGTGANYFLATTGGIAAGSTRLALANWTTETGRDGGGTSFSFAPVFTLASNLHIVNTDVINLPLNEAAITIGGITDDIDCETRATASDIGADEFVPPLCTVAAGGTITPGTISKCIGQTYSMAAVGATTGNGITYQWEVSTVGGGSGFAPVSGGTGANTVSYTTPTLNTSGTFYYRLTTTCSNCGPCSGSSNELTVTVNILPTVTLSPSTGRICNPSGTAITLTAGGASTFAYSPTSGLTPTSGSPVSANPTSTTTYTVTGTDANGCTNTASSVISVGVTPVITSATATPATVCSGLNSQLNVVVSNPGGEIKITEVCLNRGGTGGGVYPAFAPGADLIEITNISSSPVDISGWTLADYATNSTTISHTGFSFPASTIIPGNSVAVVCLGTGTNDLVNRYFITGGTNDNWLSSSLVGIVLKNGSSVIDAVGCGSGYVFNTGTGVLAGDWTGFAPTASGLAGAIRTAALDNNIGADWSASSAILLQTIGVFNSGYTPAGSYTYAWSPADFLSSTTISNPVATAVTSPKTYTVTVTGSGGCTAVSSNVDVGVFANPNAGTVSGTTPLCIGGTTTFTSDGDAGGVWTSLSPLIATVNSSSGLVSALTAGSAEIKYTVTNVNNCSAFATKAVVVSPDATAGTISGTTPLCIGTTPTYTSNGDAGGTWSSDDILIASVDANTGVVTAVGVGTTNIKYTVSTGCASPKTATKSVTVLPNANAGSITGPATICLPGIGQYTSSGDAGGTWSTSDNGIATVSASGIVTAVSAGSVDVIYTVSTGCNNPVSTFITITIVPGGFTISATPSSGIYCSSGSALSITASGATTYEWSPALGLDVTTGATVNASPLVTTTYTITGTTGGCSANTTVTVTNTTPAAIGGGASPICIGATTTLTDATGGGTWSDDGLGKATVDINTGVVTGVAAGSALITYTITATGCYVTKTITVLPNVNPGTISGTSPLCTIGATAQYTTNGDAGGTWSSTVPASASVSATGLVTALALGTTDIKYTISTGCASPQFAVKTLSVSTAPGNILASATPATICNGSNSQLQVVAGLPSTTSYGVTSATYSLQSITGFTDGPSGDDVISSAITLPFSFSFFGANYSSIFISTNGQVAFDFTGSTAAQQRNAQTIPSATLPNSNISLCWSDLDPTSGQIKYGTIGTTPNRIFVISYNAVPFFSGGGTVSGQIQLFENDNKIQIHVTSVTTSSNTKTLGIENATGTIGYVGTGRNGNAWLVSGASPEAWNFQPNGAPSGGPFTYLWSPTTFIPSGQETTANPLATAVTATTTYSVTVSSLGCPAPPVTTTVTLSPGPVINTEPSDVTKCAGQLATFTVAATGLGLTYQWRKGGVDINTISNTSAATATLSLPLVTVGDAGSYDVVITGCTIPVTSASRTLTVNALPVVTLTPSTANYCNPGGTAVALVADGAGLTGTYTYLPVTGLSPSSGAAVSATPTTTTTYVVTGTDANGCLNTASSVVTVLVNPQNVAAYANPSLICSGSTSNLSSFATIPFTANTYIFAATEGGTLDAMTGAITVVGSSVDNAPMALSGATPGLSQAIGFTFNYEGVNYTHFSASPDGWIKLGTTTTAAISESVNSIASSANVPKIAPFWDDLATGTTGNVKTLVSGTTPNRIFKVQWFVTIPRNLTGAANSTFQTWLYESTGKIEFRYGVMGTPTSGSISGGLTGLTSTNFQSLTFNIDASGTTANNTNSTAPALERLYTYSPPLSSISYAWTSPTTTVVSPSSQNTATVALSATELFTLTATYAGCSVQSSALVTISEGAVITGQPASVSKCPGQTATFTVTATGVGLTYQWRKGGVDINTTSNPSAATATLSLANVSATDVAFYDVVVTGTCGSPATSNGLSQFILFPAANIAVTPPTASYCLPGGSAVSLTASGGSTYTWSPTSGITPTTGATVSATPSANTTYTVTGTDANGCTGTASAVITLGTSLQNVTASATPSTICSGSNSQLAVTVPALPGGGAIKITEVTLSRSGTGATVSYPTLVVGADLVEISNISSAPVDISGWSLGDYYTNNVSSNHGAYSFPSGTIIPANGVALVCLGTGTDDPATLYFNTGGSNDLYLAGTLMGVILKTGASIVDAVGLNTGYVFAAGTGVTASDWSGVAPSSGTFAGTIRTSGIDNNTGADWTQSSAITPQTIGTYNSGYVAPSVVSGYAWSPSTFISGQTTLQNPLATTVTATTTYTVVVTSTAGCSATKTATVTVNPTPVIDATAASSSICGNADVQLDVTVGAMGNGPVQFSNSGSITIPASGNASPYPATVIASGLSASATVTSVTLTNFSHVFPGDVDIVLVSPLGQVVTLISDQGSSTSVTGLNLTFQDGGAAIPSTLVSGTYAPFNDGTADTYTPGPGSVSGTQPLSSFNLNPNGTWSLYVVDDASPDAGSITGGFSITFNNPVVPTYSWVPTPSGVLSSTTINNPIASVTATTTYTVTVTNPSTLCHSEDFVTITHNATPLPVITPGNQILCSGNSVDFDLTDVNYPSGYPSGTTVDWNGVTYNAGLTYNFNSTGTVSAVVHLSGAFGGCSGTATSRTVEIRSVAATVTPTPVSCSGTLGTITVQATSGLPPYRYLIMKGLTQVANTTQASSTFILTGQPAGIYSVTVFDNDDLSNGGPSCNSSTYSTEITAVTGPTATASVTHQPACDGTNDGSASVSISGGVSPYDIVWSGGTVSGDHLSISGLAPATYTVTVTDANLCSSTSSVVINQGVVITIGGTIIPASCITELGSVTSTVSGGSGIYSYEWFYYDDLTSTILTTGITDPDLIDVPVGTYYLEVSDGVCLKRSAAFIIGLQNGPTLTATPTQIACNGGTGSVTLNASGGTGTLTFSPSNPATTGLAPGFYTYTVTDDNSCSVSASATINAAPSAIVFTATPTQIVCFGGTGSVTLSASGGTGTLTYNPSNPATSGLTAGTYVYQLTDANSCPASASATINPAPNAISVTGFSPSHALPGASVVITGTGFTGATAVKFGASLSVVSFTIDSDVQITATVPAGALTGVITVTQGTCGSASSSGTFTVDGGAFASLELHVLIQGFYQGGGAMTPVLSNTGISIDPNEADTIVVELHDALSPYDLAASATGVLMVDGTCNVDFPSSVSGSSYYIVVKHRNSIETWSKDPVPFSSSTTFDFIH